MLFLSVLFVIILLLLAFALTADKGRHTIHARRNGPKPNTKMSKNTDPGGVQVN